MASLVDAFGANSGSYARLDDEDACDDTATRSSSVHSSSSSIHSSSSSVHSSSSSPTPLFAYSIIWLTYLVEGVLAATTAVLAPYVTSAFARHALTPTVGIASSVVGGVANLALARVLDVFGRPQGFAACVVLATAGLALMAACGNVASYAAAQVLQAVGNSGLQYSLTVFVADASPLRSRGLVQSLVSSPNLLTGWLAGPLSSAFLAGPGWRAAFALFALLVPAVTFPLFALLLRNQRMERRLDMEPDSQQVTPSPFSSSSSSPFPSPSLSLSHYFRQFDALGLLLLAASLALILLPFNLYALHGWSSPLVSGSLALGCALALAFVIWELRFAPVTFVPAASLLDRTVLGSCILSAALFSSYWCWNSFFGSYLQVVNGLGVANANYVVQLYSVCSVVCSVAVGLLVHYTGRFRPVCLYLGIPLSILGSGLMMYFCNIGAGVVYIVMCQIFISIASGTVMVCDEVAILAAASQQQVAVCLALLGMFGNVGGAVGLTIASAIWQDVFPSRLADYLPAEDLPHLDDIYANITRQLSYPLGSATRLAIQHAYKDAQAKMLAAGTAIWIVGFVAVLMWRDINVIGLKQSKGQVW